MEVLEVKDTNSSVSTQLTNHLYSVTDLSSPVNAGNSQLQGQLFMLQSGALLILVTFICSHTKLKQTLKKF